MSIIKRIEIKKQRRYFTKIKIKEKKHFIKIRTNVKIWRDKI